MEVAIVVVMMEVAIQMD